MFFAAAAVFAVLNWIAVERKTRALEYVAKPATTAALIGAALSLMPAHDAQRTWFVIALALCLAGDVFLMLPHDLFVPGLGSFFVGHVCFIIGIFAAPNSHETWHVLVWILILGVVLILARPVIAGARAQDRALVGPVCAYVVVLGGLLCASLTTFSTYAFPAALVFVSSDLILARNRFVKPIPHGHLLTMVTYHAALALLVVSLVR